MYSAQLDSGQLGADHKVLVVLDHGPKFARDSGATVPITVKDTGTNTLKQVAEIKKTLWSVAVECAMDMHRVVGDLFPEQNKLMRFLLSDCVGRFLTPSWGERLITQPELMCSLSSAGRAVSSEDASILNGIRLSVDAVTEKTDLYRKVLDATMKAKPKRGRRERIPIPEREEYEKRKKADKKPKLRNEGAIIIFTSVENEAELQSLEEDIVEIVRGRNNILKNLEDSSFIVVDHLQVYIMNVHPADAEPGVESIAMREIDPCVSCRVVSCKGEGELLRAAVHAVTLQVYDLVSTTVSGIPMKEESVPGQSVNYDVELFHSRAAHGHLEQLGLLASGSHLISPNGTYETVKLAWATPTPKSKWNLFPRASGAVRVSAASSNNRQSVCLTGFLLGGRNVMLEVSRQGGAKDLAANVGGKLISHTLISHAGRIYIHAIRIGQDDILDNPILRSLAGLKNVDGLRVEDFRKLMKECTIRVQRDITVAERRALPKPTVPCEQPRMHLRRLTRFWPTHLDHTFIYNIPMKFDKLFSNLRKLELSTAEVEACNEFIYEFVAQKERSAEPLTRNTFKCKSVKSLGNKSEQYSAAQSELALHIGNYVNHSHKHLEVLNSFMKLTGLERTVNVSTSDVNLTAPIKQVNQKDLSARSSPTEIQAIARNTSRSNSPLPKKARKAQYYWKEGEKLSVFQWLHEREQQKCQKQGWIDFVGRVEAGERPARLYPKLDLSTAPHRGEHK